MLLACTCVRTGDIYDQSPPRPRWPLDNLDWQPSSVFPRPESTAPAATSPDLASPGPATQHSLAIMEPQSPQPLSVRGGVPMPPLPSAPDSFSTTPVRAPPTFRQVWVFFHRRLLGANHLRSWCNSGFLDPSPDLLKGLDGGSGPGI